MTLTYEQFSQAAAEVEKIITSVNEINLNTALSEASKGIDGPAKREFYRHMNSLFLNVLLNRVDEIGEKGVERAQLSRRILVTLIPTL